MSGLKIVYFLLMSLIVRTSAAPKPLTCMSYLEDDKSLQEDDDDDFDDYSSNSAQFVPENIITPEPLTGNGKMPQRRICQADYTFCFSLWRQTANGTQIEKQGCWKESTERNATCSQTECTSSAPTSRNNSLYYCCCSGDICNQNVTVVEPAPLQLSKASFGSNLSLAKAQTGTFRTTVIKWCAFFAGCLVLVGSALAFYYCRSVKDKPAPEEAPLAPSGPGYSSNMRNVDNINLLCMLGSGKYGTVMKGLLHDQEVAVKIFPDSNHQYYINERNIYSLPLMENPSLLKYFGYDERQTMDGRVEYQLVLSLAPLGCLQDWLITNAMDFETFCRMTKSITHGLSHLHTEMRRCDEVKPCIAHRDLNSRNVLVKADRSCCIADFGFALKVFGSKYEYKGEVAMAETKSINEVGTLRYMAPELLEGAVNLRDCETSLKQMDVYALGLVLWEVATRCADFYSPAQVTPPYKAPYEVEVGTHPTFDQMQALVVRHKARPLFPSGWGGGPASKLLRDTCEDCWDHDAEARLTSLCAEERMQEVAGLQPRLQFHAQSASPLLSANNLVGEQIDRISHQQQTRNLTSDSNSNEIATILSPPPNQQVLACAHELDHCSGISSTLQLEKNHLIYPQQPIQPYQGRNPCQERNLAPQSVRTPQVLIEKSKKHSFQTGEENSFSCLEDDVSVEDLISSGSSKKFNNITNESSNMGQGFPKLQNTDKKLRGWHGVRALIQKRLFRKDGGGEVFRQLGYNDEKSNLVENRCSVVVKGLDNTEPMKVATVSFLDDKQSNSLNSASTTKTTTLEGIYAYNKRPNNLDLSPMSAHNAQLLSEYSRKLQHMNNNKSNGPNIARIDNNPNGNLPYGGAQMVPRSCSANLIKSNNNNSNSNNNNLAASELKKLKKLSTHNAHGSMSAMTADGATFGERQFKRQRSLEVFREVFGGRGSCDKLRNPSQRVKTPGDVPPSVRKVRASKTLSLYDDRMMDSSMLNIL